MDCAPLPHFQRSTKSLCVPRTCTYFCPAACLAAQRRPVRRVERRRRAKFNHMCDAMNTAPRLSLSRFLHSGRGIVVVVDFLKMKRGRKKAPELVQRSAGRQGGKPGWLALPMPVRSLARCGASPSKPPPRSQQPARHGTGRQAGSWQASNRKG